MRRYACHRRRTGLALLVALGVWAADEARAVVILDSTWREEGGRKGREWKGFAAAIALANEPQFAAVLALSSDGESWGEASGTWIGNDEDGHAYILTAAHIFEDTAHIDDYVVRAPDGETIAVDRLWVHPRWNGDLETRSGYDLVILRLTTPITGAGRPPVLYSGEDEAGGLLTFVGYGSRGIGSVGEQDRFHRGSGKAAAQGVVDEFVPPEAPIPDEDEDAGNYLGIFLPKEDGSIENPYGGRDSPATRLVGLLGSGDSGGSAWMNFDGRWVLVAVNSNGDGDGDGAYGESSWFTRVSANRTWISKIFPGARFSDDYAGPAGRAPSSKVSK